MIREELLNILACPIGKAPLRLEGNTLVCTSCGTKYRIEDDIPIMLIEEAELPASARSADDVTCGSET